MERLDDDAQVCDTSGVRYVPCSALSDAATPSLNTYKHVHLTISIIKLHLRAAL